MPGHTPGDAAPSCRGGPRRRPRPSRSRPPAPSPPGHHPCSPPARRTSAPSRGATTISISRRAEVTEVAASEVQPRLVGHLREGDREAGQRLPPLTRSEVERRAPHRAPQRLRPPEREATEDGERGPEEPVAERPLQPLGQGWGHRGKRGISYGTCASTTSTAWSARPTTTAGSRPGNVASQAARGPGLEPARGRAAGAREDALRRRARASARRSCRRTPRPSLRTLRALGFAGTDEEVLARAATRGRARCCACAPAPRRCGPPTPPPSRPRATRPTAGCTSRRPTSRQMFHRAHRGGHDARGAPRHLRRRAALRRARAAPRRRPASPTRARPTTPGSRSPGTPGGAPLRLGPAARWSAVQRTASASRRGRRSRRAQALARLHQLDPDACLFPQQHPDGHRRAARSTPTCWRWATAASSCCTSSRSSTPTPLLADAARRRLGERLQLRDGHATRELPVAGRGGGYPFNSQVLTLPDGTMAIVAPDESARASPRARALPRAGGRRGQPGDAGALPRRAPVDAQRRRPGLPAAADPRSPTRSAPR